MRGLAYREIEVRVNDRLSRLSGRSRSDDLKPRTVAYNEERAQISFWQWIDAHRARPFIRKERGRGEQICV